MTTLPTKLYRYGSTITEDYVLDGELNRIHNVELYVTEYKIVSYTPKGFWIADKYTCLPDDKWKWVSASSHKRFAYVLKYDALKAFYYRKHRQIDILSWQLDHAKRAKIKARELMEKSNA